MVEVEGETVWVPFELTLPMPSMETSVASVVRQFSTTDWPRSMASGSAVRLAVGAETVRRGGPRLAGFTVLVFLPPHPAMAKAAKASSSAEEDEAVRMERGLREFASNIGFSCDLVKLRHL